MECSGQDDTHFMWNFWHINSFAVRWVKTQEFVSKSNSVVDRDWSLCYVDDNGKENIKGFLQDSRVNSEMYCKGGGYGYVVLSCCEG